MRVLLIDDAAKAKVARVVAYANESEHHFIPAISQVPPGDNPKHTCSLNSFRCVFSITHSDGRMWRHLSISVPSKDYPNPVAVKEIACLFGFVGELKDWLCDIQAQEHCVVVAQVIDAQECEKMRQMPRQQSAAGRD